jgi:hypothetical protein
MPAVKVINYKVRFGDVTYEKGNVISNLPDDDAKRLVKDGYVEMVQVIQIPAVPSLEGEKLPPSSDNAAGENEDTGDNEDSDGIPNTAYPVGDVKGPKSGKKK